MNRSFIVILLIVLVGGGGVYFLKTPPAPNGPTIYVGFNTKQTDIFFKPHIEIINLKWESGFPKQLLQQNIKNKTITYIKWIPELENNIFSLDLKSIKNNEWQDYLIDWSEQAKSFQYPLFVELIQLKESRLDYKDAYQHIISTFKKENANNVLWVFNTEHVNSSVNKKILYPGNDFIDWLAGPTINRSVKMPSKPFILTEQDASHYLGDIDTSSSQMVIFNTNYHLLKQRPEYRANIDNIQNTR